MGVMNDYVFSLRVLKVQSGEKVQGTTDWEETETEKQRDRHLAGGKKLRIADVKKIHATLPTIFNPSDNSTLGGYPVMWLDEFDDTESIFFSLPSPSNRPHHIKASWLAACMLFDFALTSIKGFEFGEWIANSRSFDRRFLLMSSCCTGNCKACVKNWVSNPTKQIRKGDDILHDHSSGEERKSVYSTEGHLARLSSQRSRARRLLVYSQ
ncbi:hypothetical protein ACTXT7_008444 [Hymenolepis weldensis]